MEGVKEKQGQLVFGLDIGTRSIVGTVGYLNGGKFHVLAQRSKEHETRAMLDGQIHDIGKVGETISQVKEQLEADLGRELTEVCIAAAGRVLRTVTTYVEHSFESDREITQEDVYSLCTMGDVIGDLNSRRGRVEGMEDIGGGKMVKAFVPLAEMFGYSTDLRSKTQGRGQYTMEPDGYEPVPKSISESIISERAKKD